MALCYQVAGCPGAVYNDIPGSIHSSHVPLRTDRDFEQFSTRLYGVATAFSTHVLQRTRVDPRNVSSNIDSILIANGTGGHVP